MSNCRNDTVILDAHDFELVDSVASDIRSVMSEANPDTDDNTLRRMSSILRRLVVYNDYGKAWRLVISEPKFPTLIAPKLVPELPLETGILFAGGAQVGGITIALAYIGNNYADLSNEDVRKKVANTGIREFSFLLHEWRESCSININGTKVKRRHIISYVANKKGGAHFDPSREARKKDSEIYALLDYVWQDLYLSEKDGVYFEFLCMAQHLAQAPDTAAFLEAADTVQGPKRPPLR